jgi:hypothetical protein
VTPLEPKERGGLALSAEDHESGIVPMLANDDDDLQRTILIAAITAVAAIFIMLSGVSLSTKIAAVYFSNTTLTPDDSAFGFFCEDLSKFMKQDECRFIRKP